MEVQMQKVSSRQWYLWMECGLLFLAIPALLYQWSSSIAWIPLFFLVTLYCLVALRNQPASGFKFGWHTRQLTQYGPKMLLRFLVFAVLTGLWVARYAPSDLWALPNQHPIEWVLLLVWYPLLSALPQEIIYRAFFFQRYGSLFSHQFGPVLASALFFAFLHIIYHNTLAVALTLIGGIVFSMTYTRSGSLFVTAVEHSLYGIWIFTVGLGQYFSAAM